MLLTVITLLPYGVLPAQARSPWSRARVITWATCPEDDQVQCGEMRVPADWAEPYGPTTMLTIARRPATDKAARLGVLLVNPGGPGGSAVDFTFGANTFFGADVLKRFDIIGMDPRGVGRSSPVLCSRDLVDAIPSPLIETEQAFAATIAFNRKLAADCARRTGPHFAHVDTASVVRDMDAVRLALGEQQISFYGASYGTLIGEQYAQWYPSRLRALVLDSVVDHSASLGNFLIQETDAAQDAFREFVAWCTRDKRCVLRGQDILALWAGLIVRARAGTLEDPYDRPRKLRLSDLTGAAFAAFYDPSWYSFAYYLRDAAAQATGRVAPPPVDIVAHSFPAVFCEDWSLRISGFADYRHRLQVLAARAPQMLASPLAISATAGCLGWPSAPDNPQRLVLPLKSGPALLVSARHDPATNYAWAQHVAQMLGPGATLLTYQGWGHVAYHRGTCVDGFVDRFLLTLVRPPTGTSCPAIDPEPFGVG
ncbi:alpha/beta hydrolase [Micromonosporaceae bacterium Da 78-11]